MKSLNRVQTICKVLKILAMIVFVCSIVSVILCTIFAIVFGIVGNNLELINYLASIDITYDFNRVLCILICSIVQSAFYIAIYAYVVRFYKQELAVGNPFDKSLIKPMRKVGIIRIVLPLICALILAIIKGCFRVSLSFNNLTDLTMGIVFLIVSCIMEYGSEMKKNSPTNTTRK